MHDSRSQGGPVPGGGQSAVSDTDFRLIFAAGPDPCLILDTRLVIVEVNDAYLRATRTKREQLLGKYLFESFPDNPGDPGANGVEALTASLYRVLSDGVPDILAVQKYDIPIPEEEGGGFEERYWSASNVPVSRKEGAVAYIIHRVQDLTEYVHLKQRRVQESKVTEELRARVAQRDAEVYNTSRKVSAANLEIKRLAKDLAQRSAELESANKELEAFNYSVAHDLRQPLNLLGLYCQSLKMLCSDQLSRECRGYAEGILNTCFRMNGYIQALLDFSRLGRVELHRETVELSALALEIAKELELAEPGRQVEFSVSPGITCEADANLVRVVLQNLLGNAWKYTRKRAEAIIEFGATAADGRKAFFVRDNGAGFDKAFTEKLFAPFERLPGAQEVEGFGIGLATVRRIVQRHGGSIWADGEPGRGAVFYFTLAPEAEDG